MTAPGDDVSEVYRPPEAELREDLPPRGFVHPVVGFAAGMAGLMMMDGRFTAARLTLFFVSSLLAAIVLAGLRRLDWRAALVAGFLLSLGTSIAVSYIGFKLGV